MNFIILVFNSKKNLQRLYGHYHNLFCMQLRYNFFPVHTVHCLSLTASSRLDLLQTVSCFWYCWKTALEYILKHVLILCLLLPALFNNPSPCWFCHCTDGINKTVLAPTTWDLTIRKNVNRWAKKEEWVQGSNESYFC